MGGGGADPAGRSVPAGAVVGMALMPWPAIGFAAGDTGWAGIVDMSCSGAVSVGVVFGVVFGAPAFFVGALFAGALFAGAFFAVAFFAVAFLAVGFLAATFFLGAGIFMPGLCTPGGMFI